jgi:hypothetical protein
MGLENEVVYVVDDDPNRRATNLPSSPDAGRPARTNRKLLSLTSIDQELPTPDRNTQKILQGHHTVIGSVVSKLRFANLAIQRCDSQNVNVSSSAIKMTGGPPDEIFTALAKVCLPPADSAHFWSASMDGKCTSATR